MLITTGIRTVVLFAIFMSGIARAECNLQSTHLALPRYSALEETKGMLRLSVNCDIADTLAQYTLSVSSFGGRFDQTNGAYVLDAIGKNNSMLKILIQGASPALGGTVIPTVYTGNQELTFLVIIPAGQWEANGSPTIGINFDLNPYKVGN